MAASMRITAPSSARGSARLVGGEQLAAILNKLSAIDADRVLVPMLKRAAEPMRNRASELAPWAPGEPDLRDQIVTSAIDRVRDFEWFGLRELEDTEAAVGVGPAKDLYYGIMQEYGTLPHGDHPGHAAQPFMRPSFDEKVEDALRILGDEIGKWLRTWAQSGMRPSTAFTSRTL